MEVLLLNPPFLNRFSREQRSPAVTKSGTLYYPMWLSYATGHLERAGFEATLIDGVVDGGPDRLESYLNGEHNPELIIISTSTPSIYNDIEWAEKLKERYPTTKTILVGPHASALYREILTDNQFIDAVAIGEYEQTCLEIANRVKDGEDLSGIAGIAHNDNGEVIVEEKREPIRDVDEIPFVSKTYHKHLNYRDYFYAHSKYPIVTILSARGCPYNCTYCVYPQVFSGHKYRPRKISSVVEELEFIQDNFNGVKEVMFEDDTFIIDEERTRELARTIIKSDFDLPFSCNSRADVSFETLSVLGEAGCRLLCVGVESGSQDILNNTRKRTNREEIEQFFRDARRTGIMIHGCFMLGNPGETEETIADTIDFAKRLSPDTAQFFPVMCYPGTQIYDEMKRDGKLTTEDFRKWIKEDGMHNCIVNTDNFNSEQLVDLCDMARRSFYLDPDYLLKKLLQSMLSADEFYRNLKAFRRFFTHLIRSD